MTITMKNVAQKLGISVSTVSRALNNDKNISAKVKKKIFELTDSSEFKRKGQKSNIIPFFIDKNFFISTEYFYNRVIEGIEETLSKNSNYIFQFILLDQSIHSIKNLNININKIAGVIISGSYRDSFILEIKKLNIPLVLVDYYLPAEDISSILIDNIDGIIKGMKYLSELGHKEIAYLSGDIKSDIGSQDRLTGYLRSLELFNLAKNDNYIISSDFTIKSSYESMKKFMCKTNKFPTAIMTANDIVAIGVMEAIKEAGLKIPEDISVLGFDDIELAGEVIPKLSTMRIKKKTMGSLAVKRLIKLINNEEIEYSKIIVMPELIIRDSTAKIL